MKYGIYSVRDRLTGFFQPTVEVNDQSAYRNFEHVILSGDSLMSSHSADYDLAKIGWFDSDSGRIDAIDPVEIVCTGNAIFLSNLRRSSDAVPDQV